MTVAIYIRLSLEDADVSGAGKLESESVTNQRKMLQDYVTANPAFADADVLEFCDDGYSGKNFERPGFTALIEAARSGRVQCIVVKDLSRFGRDYITVGNYISKVFPFLGVRFIAINDSFDSNRKGDIDSLDTSFKTLIYDMYSRDLSKKVRSAKKSLVERAVYINPTARYGFLKDPEDKHRLMIDPVAGPVVRRIFEEYVQGCSATMIATNLNAENIPTPARHKLGTSSSNTQWPTNGFWTGTNINAILRDPQYMGTLVWGKTVRPQIGVHGHIFRQPEEWVQHENIHEAIVSAELFEAAQKRIGKPFRHTTHTKQDYPLRSKVYCGICGYAISRNNRKHPYYRCSTPKTMPTMDCYREKIFADELMQIVVAEIQSQARYAVELQRIVSAQRRQNGKRLELLQKDLQELDSLLDRLTTQGQQYYERFVDGTMTKDAFLTQKAALTESQSETARKKELTLQEIAAAQAETNQFVARYSKYADLDELTTAIAEELVDRITVYPDGRIDIRLNYPQQQQ